MAYPMRAILVAMLLGGCGDGGGDSRDSGPDGSNATASECVRLQTEFRALVAGTDRSCTQSTECALVGAVESCNCSAYLSDSQLGTAISATGYTAIAGDLDPLLGRWRELGCAFNFAPEVGNVCDGRAGEVACTDNQCTVGAPSASCFGTDAGVGDLDASAP